MMATCVEVHGFRGLYVLRFEGEGRGGVGNGFVYSIHKVLEIKVALSWLQV
jgi:hypothetical protein